MRDTQLVKGSAGTRKGQESKVEAIRCTAQTQGQVAGATVTQKSHSHGGRRHGDWGASVGPGQAE